MIDYDPRSWGAIVLSLRGSVLPRLAVRLVICAAMGGAAVWADRTYGFHLAPIAHTMIGVALGLLLVFRTNASYDRYWEGRRLLGAMVIRVRDLTRQLVGYLPGREHERTRKRVRDLGCAYFRLAAMALRGETKLAEVPGLTGDDRAALEGVTARPQVVSAWITSELARAAAANALTEQRLYAMDQNVFGLTDALAGCERILRTPIPFAYAQHIKTFVVLFCFSAPFAMSESMGPGTPIAAALLGFALFGIDEIGVEIEDPFGYDPNDLPIDQMAEGLEKTTLSILGASGPT